MLRPVTVGAQRSMVIQLRLCMKWVTRTFPCILVVVFGLNWGKGYSVLSSLKKSIHLVVLLKPPVVTVVGRPSIITNRALTTLLCGGPPPFPFSSSTRARCLQGCAGIMKHTDAKNAQAAYEKRKWKLATILILSGELTVRPMYVLTL